MSQILSLLSILSKFHIPVPKIENKQYNWLFQVFNFQTHLRKLANNVEMVKTLRRRKAEVEFKIEATFVNHVLT